MAYFGHIWNFLHVSQSWQLLLHSLLASKTTKTANNLSLLLFLLFNEKSSEDVLVRCFTFQLEPRRAWIEYFEWSEQDCQSQFSWQSKNKKEELLIHKLSQCCIIFDFKDPVSKQSTEIESPCQCSIRSSEWDLTSLQRRLAAKIYQFQLQCWRSLILQCIYLMLK